MSCCAEHRLVRVVDELTDDTVRRTDLAGRGRQTRGVGDDQVAGRPLKDERAQEERRVERQGSRMA